MHGSVGNPFLAVLLLQNLMPRSLPAGEKLAHLEIYGFAFAACISWNCILGSEADMLDTSASRVYHGLNAEQMTPDAALLPAKFDKMFHATAVEITKQEALAQMGAG